jgi:NNP family nitrate/nitrite transporter-like MFS transporter
VLDRTEGWAAGLQLAASYLSTRGGERAIASFVGARGVVADYLIGEVLVHQPPEVRRFLMYTSIVEEVTWHASYLYAVALGGYVAFSVYLPAYLANAYRVSAADAADAANRMAGFVLLAVLMRPVGGWLSDRLGSVQVLRGALVVVIVASAVQAFTPRLDPLGTVALLSMAAGLGVASAATLALVALLAPASMIGSVAGVTGAVGGLAGFLPPLVMGMTYSWFGSYAGSVAMLTAAAVMALVLTSTTIAAAVRRAPHHSSARV